MPYIPTDYCSEMNVSACGNILTPTLPGECGQIHFDGIDNTTILQGETFDLTSGVHAYDANGNEIPFRTEPNLIDTCMPGEHVVKYISIGGSTGIDFSITTFCADPLLTIPSKCGGSGGSANRVITVTEYGNAVVGTAIVGKARVGYTIVC